MSSKTGYDKWLDAKRLHPDFDDLLTEANEEMKKQLQDRLDNPAPHQLHLLKEDDMKPTEVMLTTWTDCVWGQKSLTVKTVVLKGK